MFKKLLISPFLIVSLILFFKGCSGEKEVTPQEEKSDREVKKDAIPEGLKEEISKLMDQALIPGLSIAVIRNGDIHWQAAFGKKSSTTGEPVKADTVFEAASLSKPVFAYGVMKLVESKQLDLDMPLVNYVSRDYLEKVYPKSKTEDKRFNEITARIVLTHSTGFPNWFRDRPLSFAFSPGERFSYSGEAFTLLAKVVEKLTGSGLRDFMDNRVLKPLGMVNSSFVWIEKYDKQFSAAHNSLGKVTRRGKRKQALAGASLYTTALDYVKFLTALLNHTGLNQKSVAEMVKQQIKVLDRQGKNLCFYWGLGIGVNQSEKGASFWHWGDNGDFKAYFEVFPQEKVGVVYFANSRNGLAIADKIVEITTGARQPAIKTAYFSYPHYTSPEIKCYYLYSKKGVDAVVSFIQDVKQSPEAKASITEEVMQNFGSTLIFAQDLKGAKAIFENNVRLFPQSAGSYRALGGIYLVEGDKDRAMEFMKKSITLKPDQERQINSMGYLLLRIEKIEEAIEVFKFNVKSYPKSANCYDSLAEAYLKEGDKEKAKKFYKEALKIDPNFTSSINALKNLEEQK
jgi:CubicO group peptidase (beta-lactamase class C family)/Tfp pilus assembly protein PilF